MFLKPGISLGLGLCLFLSPAPANDKKVSFDGQAAMILIKALAADTMQGRKSGEIGYEMAVDHVVSKFKEWGLAPAALFRLRDFRGRCRISRLRHLGS